MMIQYSVNNRSVRDFIRYLYLRNKAKQYLSPEEEKDLYPVYLEFCTINSIDYFGNQTFKRELKNYGFTPEVIWDKEQKRSRRVMRIDPKLLATLALEFLEVTPETHSTYTTIGGIKYKIVMSFERLE